QTGKGVAPPVANLLLEPTMKPGALLLLLLAGCATAPVPVAIIHESDTPAGTTAGDTISVTLELKRAMWYPETDADPGAEVWAIVADGGQPLIPGPLLRGNVNTTFRVTVRNPSHDSVLVVHG